jgi:hypothetical protein
VSPAGKKNLSMIGSKIKMAPPVTQKAKWFKRHAADAQFKGLKGKAKLSAMTKYRKQFDGWKKIVVPKTKKVSKKLSKKPSKKVSKKVSKK